VDSTNDRGMAMRPLEVLGISDSEELVYRALVERHKACSTRIAVDLGIDEQEAGDWLEHLETLGLATYMPETPKVYIAVDPELAIDALIKQRQRALEQARNSIPALMKSFSHTSDADGEQPILELITNRAYLGAVLDQMYKSLRSEILLFQKAPILVPAARTSNMLPVGGQVRSISDKTFLDSSDGLANLLEDMALGEQARTVPALPFKMMIVDRRTAVMTLDGQSPETASTLLIRRGALVEALCQLFEFVWEKATPVFAVPDGKVESGSQFGEHWMESTEALIPLMAAGLNDKAITQELQISASTLNRRVGDLMRMLGARTRFQLGVHLAQKFAMSSQQSS